MVVYELYRLLGFFTLGNLFTLNINEICKFQIGRLRPYFLQVRMFFLNFNVFRFLSPFGFLAEISFTPLLYHPEGCLGCPEKRTSSKNYNLFVLIAVFQLEDFIISSVKNCMTCYKFQKFNPLIG